MHLPIVNLVLLSLNLVFVLLPCGVVLLPDFSLHFVYVLALLIDLPTLDLDLLLLMQNLLFKVLFIVLLD